MRNARMSPKMRMTIDTIRQIDRGEVGRLRVGIVGSAMWGPIPSLLEEFQTKFPRVTWTLHESGPNVQYEALRAKQIDVGFWRLVGSQAVEDFTRQPSTLHPKALDVWGVDASVLGVDPNPLQLTGQGRTGSPLAVGYEIVPPEYGAGYVAITVEENGEERYAALGTQRTGQGAGVLPRGLAFDLAKSTRRG